MCHRVCEREWMSGEGGGGIYEGGGGGGADGRIGGLKKMAIRREIFKVLTIIPIMISNDGSSFPMMKTFYG